MWTGWRRGFIRSGAALAGMLLGFAVGWALFKISEGIFAKSLPGLGAVLGVGLGLLGFLVVYGGLQIVSGLLFKKTEHQRSGLVRFLYGAGGAVVGLAIGLLVVSGVASAIRIFGAVAESRTADGTDHRPAWTKPILDGVAKAKESLEMGESGRAMEKNDPLPAEFRDILVGVTQMSSDPAAAERLLEYPGIRPVLEDARMVELTTDPEIADAASKKDFARLFSNPKLWAAVNDPAFVAKLQKVDLREALQYALTPQKSDRPAVPAPTP